MRYNRYIDLIEQTFDFPQESFEVFEGELYFNGISLMDLIKEYGTPLRISYLPKISLQIQKAKSWFNQVMVNNGYQGTYTYCYCTKSSQFKFIIEEALKNDIHLETSSAFDIPIVKRLYEEGWVTKNNYIICNGYKRPLYIENIAELANNGFKNLIAVLDNIEELEHYKPLVKKKMNIGIRVAAEEVPTFEFYTSRLGIRYNDIVNFYKEKIRKNKKFTLKMLHFFINTGIQDTSYFWSELAKCINVYCQLKKVCPTLDSLNVGGGFPFKNSLNFNYDYEYMIEQIIFHIKSICEENNIHEPNLFTEFGSFTVAESGAHIYSVLGQKKQNDRELWYMIDNSFITNLPDTWGIRQRFIMLPVNNWEYDYHQVNLGGLSCDSQDYYNSDVHINQVFLPKLNGIGKQYLGFFHTGAYQESLAGYGGIQHCLMPAPRHVLIEKGARGELETKIFAEEQTHEDMLRILGY